MEVDLPGDAAALVAHTPGDGLKGDPGLCHEGYMGMAHNVRGDLAPQDPL